MKKSHEEKSWRKVMKKSHEEKSWKEVMIESHNKISIYLSLCLDESSREFQINTQFQLSDLT